MTKFILDVEAASSVADMIKVSCNDLENVRNSKNVIDLFGKYIDISNDNLNKYYQNGLILPYYQNPNASLYGQSLYKNIFNEGKKTEITGFNNFAKASKEVLFFVFIDSKNIKYRLDPLMQDIIYAFLDSKLSEHCHGEECHCHEED